MDSVIAQLSELSDRECKTPVNNLLQGPVLKVDNISGNVSRHIFPWRKKEKC